MPIYLSETKLDTNTAGLVRVLKPDSVPNPYFGTPTIVQFVAPNPDQFGIWYRLAIFEFTKNGNTITVNDTNSSEEGINGDIIPSDDQLNPPGPTDGYNFYFGTYGGPSSNDHNVMAIILSKGTDNRNLTYNLSYVTVVFPPTTTMAMQFLVNGSVVWLQDTTYRIGVYYQKIGYP